MPSQALSDSHLPHTPSLTWRGVERVFSGSVSPVLAVAAPSVSPSPAACCRERPDTAQVPLSPALAAASAPSQLTLQLPLLRS